MPKMQWRQTATSRETGGVYYNEWADYGARWLVNLALEGGIPPGRVDTRSITEVRGADCARTSHFFAGIGGWPLALRLAGWPDDRAVWTGSCPCQPFSGIGKRDGDGTGDERHLWPVFFALIAECRPPVVFGEQVAGPAGLRWLDGVLADLEGIGYACGAANLCAAGVGLPHERERLYWVAHAQGTARLRPVVRQDEGSQYRVLSCPGDGKTRRACGEPGVQPLAHGVPRSVGPNVAGLESLGFGPRGVRRVLDDARRNRTGRITGYGNAIVPELAARFVRAAVEAINDAEGT